MINKDIIIKEINEMNSGDILTIYYDGFEGRGINGVSSKDISISKSNCLPYIVSETSWSSGEKFKTEILEYYLENDYIKARYSYYRKDRYEKNFIKSRTSSMVIPYDRINSLEIKERKLKENK